MHRVLALTVLAVLVTGGAAHAGRTHFGWLYGTELVPENGTEVETWILEENKKGDNEGDETAFWWSPVFSLTQHLEIAIPIEAAFEDEHDGNAGVHFTRWGAEVRYRPQSPDPIDAGPFATVVRAGAKRIIEDRAGVRFEADLIASYTSGRVFVEIDLGGITERVPDGGESEFRPSAGVSVNVVRDFRLGVESYGELILDGDGTSWLVVGPTMSITSGRFWGAATLGIGLFGLRDAPRLTFGVAL